LARHVLRFEVTADAFAVFREAMSHLRRASDARPDDDASLLAMARAVLGGPRDEGRSSYQIALSVCSECGRGAQPAAGESVRVASEIVTVAWCDAQNLGPTSPAANQNDAIALDVDSKAIDNLDAGPAGPTHHTRKRTQTGASARATQAHEMAGDHSASGAPMNDTGTHGSCAPVGTGAGAPTNDTDITGTHGSSAPVGTGAGAGAPTNDESIARTERSCGDVDTSSGAPTNGTVIAGTHGSSAPVIEGISAVVAHRRAVQVMTPSGRAPRGP
jgi:hypothetical protein